MFADVTARETGRQAASRAGWLLGSTGVQAGLVAALVALSLGTRPPPEAAPAPIGQPVFLPRPPAPPAPPAGPVGRSSATSHANPAPPPAGALVQPVEITPVASTEAGPPDPVPAAGTDDAGPGIVGGGYGAAPAEEEAVFAQAGYRAPALAARGCVQQSVRVPRDLAGYVSGPIVVKFAVGRDGAPSRFSIVGGGVPDRLGDAIWQAVSGCRWIAGADPAGQPVSIWVVMPLRFAAE